MEIDAQLGVELVDVNTRLNNIRATVLAAKTHILAMEGDVVSNRELTRQYRAIAETNGIPVTPVTPSAFLFDIVNAEGNSITSGTQNNPNPWVSQLAVRLGSPVTVGNYGYSATTLNQMKDNWLANDHSGTKFVQGKRNLVIFGPSSATNDFTQDNASAAQLQGYLQIWGSKAKASGYTVWDCTELPRAISGDYTSAHEVERLKLNAWKRANSSTYCHKLIDTESVVTLAMLPDGLHPDDATGSKNICDLIYDQVVSATPVVSGDITTNGVIDNAKYVAMAAKLSRAEGIAYRYGSPSPAVANKPTWFQPDGHPWPQDIVGTHSGVYQLGTFRTYDGAFQGGDFASNSLLTTFVADNPSVRIGTTQMQSTNTDHGTFTEKPELPWVYYGRGIDAVEALYWRDQQGKTVQNPVCIANALGRPGWAVQPLICHQNGFICTAGFNTMTNKSSTQIPAGIVPSGVAITSANEFGLIIGWDTINIRGVLIVVSLCGLGHDATIANPNNGNWWNEWIKPHPGLHNLGNLVFQKVLGVMTLPGMLAPTEISATTHHSRFGYLDGSEGEPSCYNQDFDNESIRQNWKAGGNRSGNYAKQGEAWIISKTEKKAIVVNLKPLWDYMNSMYFGDDVNKYYETRNIGQGAGQWPYTFAERPQQIPTITKTFDLDDEPTCVFISPYAYREEWRQAWIGSKNGKVRIYNTGGVNDTGNASVKNEIGSFNVGLNPTSIGWIKEKSRSTEKALVPETTRQLLINVRGDNSVKWYDMTSTTTVSLRRTFRDTRMVDNIHAVDTDNHGGEHYVINVSDYSARKVHGVRFGPMIMWTYPEQTRLEMGQYGTDEFEFGGSFDLEGNPFCSVTANVS